MRSVSKKGQFVDGLWGYKLFCEHFIKPKCN